MTNIVIARPLPMLIPSRLIFPPKTTRYNIAAIMKDNEADFPAFQLNKMWVMIKIAIGVKAAMTCIYNGICGIGWISINVV